MPAMVTHGRIRQDRLGNANARFRRCVLIVSPWAPLLLLITLFFSACRGTPTVSGPPSIRLVELLNDAETQAEDDAFAQTRPRIEWRFDAPHPSEADAEGAATLGWIAGGGVAGLEIHDKLLVGRSTGNFPIIHTEVAAKTEDSDLVHSVEVRANVTKGASLAVAFQTFDTANPAALRGPRARLLSTPLLAGEGMKTYTIRCTNALMTHDLRHLLLRPSDVEDAEFEVESVRVITLKEHLAEAPAGVGWYGLSEIYNESIVVRTPVAMRFNVTLPEHPWLDLAMGTIEDGAVTFGVGVGPAAQEATEEKALLKRTVTFSKGWEKARVDLADYAGQEVALTLHVDASQAGAVGFWGNPVLRNSGASPAMSPSRPADAAEPPQGVILILAGALRRDHLGVYGYDGETAPVLARMASQGTLFRDCVSQATWTRASAPSILTSLYPTAHTVRDVADRLPSAAQTLAEVYREAGYATLSMSSTPSTGQSSNLHQGFETLHESDSLHGEKPAAHTTEYVDRLLPWLEVHREAPFFVFLDVFEPDDPYREEKEAPSRDRYDEAIRDMDMEIGRLLEGLGELGLTEKTVVAFVGAHGQGFLEHGEAFQGRSVYGELANVPLLLMGPGAIPAGHVVETTVQTIDLMPTLLEMSGLELPENAQGTSLLPLLAPPDSASASSPAVTEKPASSLAAKGECESYAIIMDGWKLIHNTQRIEGQPEFELYNHREDPLDQANVAAENADRVERLSTELAGWRERALSGRVSSGAASTAGASPEELERLQGLGYL